MTTSSDVIERLRRQTGQAMARHAAVEAQTEARRAPEPGDLYVLTETAESGLEWAVLERDPGDPHRFLMVPADDNPATGSADVAAPEGSARGPLTLRCAHGKWLDADRLDPELRSGALEPECLERAREKRRRVERGERVGSVLERRVDADPEYRDWVAGVLEPAREALSAPLTATLDTFRQAVELRPVYYLEGFVDRQRQTWRTRISGSRLIVGRRSDSDLVLEARRASQRHAELFRRQDRLWIRDLGSTNGTYVNGRRLTEACPLRDGDVVHFGDHELRFVAETPESVQLEKTPLDPSVPGRMAQFRREFLHQLRVKARFQPLVRLDDRTAAGYQLVGSGELEGTEWQPPALFQLAAGLGQESELGAAFRAEGLSQARRLPAGQPVLVNLHPSELSDERRLIESLASLRRQHPEQALVLEISEAGITGPDLANLRADLDALGIGIALGDFGSRRSRLEQLLEAQPRYVKFDRAWTRDLHLSSSSRQEMVADLVKSMAGRGITTVAEGIDSEAEGQACVKLGFDLAQGSHFGRPLPAEAISAPGRPGGSD